MNLVVILPTRQNKNLTEKIQSKLGQNDRLIAVDIPKFPARKLDEIIWRDISGQDYNILIISPLTVDIADDFIEVFKFFVPETENILVRSPLEEFDDFYFTNDAGLLRSSDCILFRKSLYKRQLGDIMPHADYLLILKELVKNVGRGGYYTPLRDQKKLQLLFEEEERSRKTEEERKKELLLQKLNAIKERRKLREEERNKRSISLQKLKEDISRLEEELSRQEEELSRQEAEFTNSENIIASKIIEKENELKRIKLRIADKEIFLKRIKEAECSREYIRKISDEIDRYKRMEQEMLEAQNSVIVNIQDENSMRKISLKRRIEERQMPRKKSRRGPQWIQENQEIRRIILSMEPEKSNEPIKIKKIEWD